MTEEFIEEMNKEFKQEFPKEKFNLSEKIIKEYYIKTHHVREFIKRLKEFSTTHSCDIPCQCSNDKIEDQNCWVIPKDEFEKLAGRQLLEEEN